MINTCPFCNLSGLVYENSSWGVKVSRTQHTLGTMLIILKRHTINFSNLSTKEREDLFRIFKELESTLTKNFKPDLFNYLQLGNQQPHLHLHLVPRYKKEIVFKNKSFKDKNYGDLFKIKKTKGSEKIINALEKLFS